MFKGRGRSDKFVCVGVLFAVAVWICTVGMCGCGYRTIGGVEDYDAFLSSYTKYGKENPLPADPDGGNEQPVVPPTEHVAKISGFVPVSDEYFSYGKAFSGGCAFVKRGEQNAVLYRDGTVRPIGTDLSDAELINGLYVFDEAGKKGVKDLTGQVVLPPEYDTVQICGETILAVSGRRAMLYRDKVLQGETYFDERVALIDERYVLCDGAVCDLAFREPTACGYPYADIPYENKVAIKLENGLFGYADIARNIRIGTAYIEVQRFSEGVAVATTPENETVVIDEAGNVLYTAHDVRIGERSGGYACYLSLNMYGVLDADFRDVTGRIFPFVRYEKPVCGYLIVRYDAGERIYSVARRDYVSAVFDCVEFAEGLFTAKDRNGVTLFDEQMKSVLRCDAAQWGDDVLTVCADGKYAYYVRERL